MINVSPTGHLQTISVSIYPLIYTIPSSLVTHSSPETQSEGHPDDE